MHHILAVVNTGNGGCLPLPVLTPQRYLGTIRFIFYEKQLQRQAAAKNQCEKSSSTKVRL
ncbi:MAG: hypothetical protein RMZ41_031570 [Nostoc sp. DedVER02]|uniref:hypothetical protein n=1 Tax=unclassified Nostoc TaxID=2593658 RepID=UPI002AD3DCE5|nr:MULTISPECIES: hypothetical protein [unclassified Nostoc]MDZ7988639.1 hypothetical protein [Nostoc sp. DedVER02]MDZ8114008.1 hypothetical protein [Nostoc sp. DedVER01b]